MNNQKANAQRLFGAVQARLRQSSESECNAYEDLAQRLPMLLAHNGLRLTLDYLRFKAAPKKQGGREDAAAAALLQDWAQADASPAGAPWTLAAMHRGLCSQPWPSNLPASNYRLASQLARQEAQWIKRFAQSLIDEPAQVADDAPQAAGTAPATAYALTNAAHPSAASAAGALHHPGLFWRFGGQIFLAGAASNEGEFRAVHVRKTVKCAKESAGTTHPHAIQYKQSFKRREHWLRQQRKAVCTRLQLQSRLKTGVGEPGVFECQLALHPATGMPRLLGSGLKGLLRNWCYARKASQAAEQNKAEAGTADNSLVMPDAVLRALFGHQGAAESAVDDEAGALVIHDAWWCPSAGTEPLAEEVNTTHHASYYSGRANQPSAYDSPQPNAQLACSGSFLFAIESEGIGPEWASMCMAWLCQALAEEGAGASRRVGYGRFQAPAAGASTKVGT